MATGPEHYLLAQNALLTALTDGIPAQDVTKLQIDGIGHAILALAAAVGTYGESDATRTLNDVRVWERVAGEYTAQQRRDAAERNAKPKCPCGCSGGPDDCTCGDGSCRCDDCPVCDPIPHARAAEVAQEAWAEQREAAVDEALDALDTDEDALTRILEEGVGHGPVWVSVLSNVDGGPDVSDYTEANGSDLVARLLKWKDAAVTAALPSDAQANIFADVMFDESEGSL